MGHVLSSGHLVGPVKSGFINEVGPQLHPRLFLYLKAEEKAPTSSSALLPLLSPRARTHRDDGSKFFSKKSISSSPSKPGEQGAVQGVSPFILWALDWLTRGPVTSHGPAPPLLAAGDGGKPSDRWTPTGPRSVLAGLRMAAIVRGGHARQGGRGRAHGGGGPRGARAAAEPAQVLNPVGFQWDFWKEGNCNTSGKVNKEMELEMKIYRVLEKDPRVHPDELHSYGVAAGLLTQADDVVRMLHDVVALYNKMAKTRRWFLYRKIQGAWGKEMSSLLKTIQSDGESVVSMVDDIKAANGFCPPTPTVFKALPKLN